MHEMFRDPSEAIVVDTRLVGACARAAMQRARREVFEACGALIDPHGAAIGLISCWKGFNCDPGASGVGKAATAAFVASFLAIIAINFILADFLNELYYLFFPTGVQSPFL